MTELVTREMAFAQLRLDDDPCAGSPDAVWLDVFIPAISEAVISWVKSEGRCYVPEMNEFGIVYDSSGEPVPALDNSGGPTVKPVVVAAVLLELASAYRFREGEGRENVVAPDAGYGYVLNKSSTALLTPLRKPTVA